MLKTNVTSTDYAFFTALAAAGSSVQEALPKFFEAAPGCAEALKFVYAQEGRGSYPLIDAIRPIDSRGKLAVPKWIALAGDNRAAVRQMALDQLTNYGPAARGALVTARGCLRDSNVLVRVFAARLVWSLTREPKEVMPVLVEASMFPH